MPEIVEKAETVLGRKVGPLPVAGWAAIGIGAIVVVKLLRGGGGSGSSTVTIPDAFPGGDAGGGGGASGDGGTIPASSPPAGSGSTATVNPSTVHITSKTDLWDKVNGKVISAYSNATLTVKKGPAHGGGFYWYQITSGKSAGKWLLLKPSQVKS